jgi:hypothetical protein
MPAAKMAEDLFRKSTNVSDLPNLSMGEIDNIHIFRALNSIKGGRMEVNCLGSFNNVFDFDFNSSHFSLLRNLPSIKKGFVKFIDSNKYQKEAILANCRVRHYIDGRCPIGLVASKIGINNIKPRLFFNVGWSEGWRTKKEIDLLINSEYVSELKILEGSWIIPIREQFRPFAAVSKILEKLIDNGKTRNLAKLIASVSWGKMSSDGGGSLWNPFYAAEILANSRVAITELAMNMKDYLIAFTIDGLLLTKPLPDSVLSNKIGGMKVSRYDNVVSLSDYYRYFPSVVLDNWKPVNDGILIDSLSVSIPYIVKFGGDAKDLGKKMSSIKIPYGSTKRKSPRGLNFMKLQRNQYKLNPPTPEEAIELYFGSKDIVPVGF